MVERISNEKLDEVTENLLAERHRLGGDAATIKGVGSITDIFVELREVRSRIREMEHIRDIWLQDYEQLVQVAEMYIDAFGVDEMLTATEALHLTIARWRKGKQENGELNV